MDSTIKLADGRTVGFATYGSPQGTPVIWCHGGPGSRKDPIHRHTEAVEADLLLIGIDRPGYGRSTPLRRRTIADWIPDALAVVNDMCVDTFLAVGESTGGAYALAVAALVPDHVQGVVACCSLTDMRNEAARSTMSPAHCLAVWDAPDRQSALDAAIAAHGEGGSKMTGGGMNEALAPSDATLFRDPEWMQMREQYFQRCSPRFRGLHRRQNR